MQFHNGDPVTADNVNTEQATEMDRGKREVILHWTQQLLHEKAMYAPLLELAIHSGTGRASRSRPSASS